MVIRERGKLIADTKNTKHLPDGAIFDCVPLEEFLRQIGIDLVPHRYHDLIRLQTVGILSVAERLAQNQVEGLKKRKTTANYEKESKRRFFLEKLRTIRKID